MCQLSPGFVVYFKFLFEILLSFEVVYSIFQDSLELAIISQVSLQLVLLLPKSLYAGIHNTSSKHNAKMLQ